MDALHAWLMTESPDVEPMSSLDAWWARHRELAQRFERPIDNAIAGGFAADRLGYAFASGYQAAGVSMFGIEARPSAFCATENGSAHPSAIETKLTRDGEGARLDGEKSFVTLGTFAERLLIVATEGKGDDGRNRLRLVSIDNRDGVTIHPLPAAPFVPEIPHASVTLENVAVSSDEIFEGDGYTRFLKPFRTVEDIHVHGALLGWLLRISRRCWPQEISSRILACATTIHALAELDPSAPAGHIALGGAMATVRDLLERIDPLWSEVDDDLRTRWERDRALLKVAGKARAKRFEAAWRQVSKSTKSGA